MNTKSIFCPKCHRLAAEIRRTSERVELRQNGRVLISMSAESKANRISVRCPSGHSVKVEI